MHRLWVGACLLAMALGPAGHTQQPATPDSTVPLFAVMAAINAAGFDADLESPRNSPLRQQLRRDIAAANPPVLPSLRAFYAARRHPIPARDLSQFISFALVLGGPPDFPFRVKEAELPAEVSALSDFRPLLAQFYREAGLERLWEEKYRGAYEQELQRYDEGLAKVMLETNGYLRLPSSGFLGRSFWIYVDLLGLPGQVNARSFGPDYYVVMSPSAQPQLDEVRHGYLHYVLEPMAGKYSALIRAKASLREFAEGAHALDPVLRKNFRLLLSESLIRAVELRMSRGSPVSRDQKLHQVLAEGHILAPYFYEALMAFEKQETGMRLYYPEMIEKLDTGREEKRLARVTFRAAPMGSSPAPHMVALEGTAPATPAASQSSAPWSRAARPGTAAAPPSSEEEKLIAEGEDAFARQDFAAAHRSFQAAADLNGPQRGAALYGLALAATQERQPEVAKRLFQQTLESTREPRLLAWSNIYLGRIFDMEQNREMAVKHYREALRTGAAEEATRLAAERGLAAPFRR